MAVDIIHDKGWSFIAMASEQLTNPYSFVKATSAATAGTATNRPDEIIQVMLCNASGDVKSCVGVALQAGSTGDDVAVATEGIYRFKAAAAVDAGRPVMPDVTDPRAVIEAGSLVCTGSTKELEYRGGVAGLHSAKRVGYALNTAGSEEYCFVKLAF
jgi:hypothetical protein